MGTKQRKRSRPITRKLRLLKTLHMREVKGLPPPAYTWFNAQARRIMRSLIKSGLLTDNPGIRLTAKGRTLVSSGTAQASNQQSDIGTDEQT